MNRADFSIGTGGNTNFAKFTTHANSATGNTSNTLVDKVRVGGSTIEFSDTELQWKVAASNGTYTLSDATEGTAAYTVISPDQNYEYVDQKRIINTSNGTFRVRTEMTSTNSHVSPVIDLDRLNLISIENVIDNGGLSNSDISISTRGSGYVNITSQAVTATVVGGGTDNTATVNCHVEVTFNCISNSSSLFSSNGDYTVTGVAPAAFKIGEAVMANTDVDNLVGAGNGQSGLWGIVSAVTHLEGNTSKNVSSVTIKTNANNSTTLANGGTGGFSNTTHLWANPNAQLNAVASTLKSCIAVPFSGPS